MRTGEPARAREVWELAGDCDEALRTERMASTYLVEGNYVAASANYRLALSLSPDCVEAYWGLARLALETGDAAYMVRQCEAGLQTPGISDRVRNSLEWMRDLAQPYSTPRVEDPALHEEQ